MRKKESERKREEKRGGEESVPNHTASCQFGDEVAGEDVVGVNLDGERVWPIRRIRFERHSS